LLNLSEKHQIKLSTNYSDQILEEPLVLQRSKISIGGFLNSGSIFGLAVVCAVIGAVTNISSHE
jgi:hypothetical protein